MWEMRHNAQIYVEYLSCGEIEVLGYYQLSNIRYNDRNTVTERVSTAVPQLYLIWTAALILEHVKEFQRWI